MIGPGQFAGEPQMLLVTSSCTRFQLGFQRQARYVNGHLVTIEVGVIGRTNQGGCSWIAFVSIRTGSNARYPNGAGLVHGSQYWVFANHFVQDIPNDGFFTLNHFPSGFDGGGQATQLQFAVDERFEQLQRHLLRQTALMQTQVWILR